MPDTSIETSRVAAIELYNVINIMSGGANYKLLRANLQKRIFELWPEIKEKGISTPKDEFRKLALSSREQKAVAEGLLELINQKDKAGHETLTGQEFNFLINIAKTCKISKWLNSQIELFPVPNFEEELDDEIPISD